MRLLTGTPIAERIKAFCRQQKVPAGLGVIRIGDDPASKIYTTYKRKAAQDIGFHVEEAVFDAATCPQRILDHIAAWNTCDRLSGILLQLPLPTGHDAARYIQAIAPEKDIDGLRPCSLFTPCTPLGCLLLLHAYHIPLRGKHCVVIGRSALVGKPLALLLVQEDATVTIAHSKTQDLAAITRTADIIFGCTGAPGLITQEHVSPQAIVLDIGIYRSDEGIVGDAVPDLIVAAKTPVPGGIGPMTVSCLLWNTLKAAAPSLSLASLKESIECVIP